jgi:hypothetical protein
MTDIKTQNEVVENRVTEMAVDSIHPAPTGPGQMALEAIKSGAGKEVLEHLEKAWEMQQSFDRDAARKAYYEAMSRFAANQPDIEKDRSVGYENRDGTTTGYSHASLDNVTKKIQVALSAESLHASWRTSQGEKGEITVTCSITHSGGHSQDTSLTAPPDSTGKKNSIQAIGSTISYLERYTILSLTGLSTRDMDDDGAGSEPAETLNDEQFANLQSLISEVGADEAKFCKYLQVADLDHLPAARYNAAIKALEAKKK